MRQKRREEQVSLFAETDSTFPRRQTMLVSLESTYSEHVKERDNNDNTSMRLNMLENDICDTKKLHIRCPHPISPRWPPRAYDDGEDCHFDPGCAT